MAKNDLLVGLPLPVQPSTAEHRQTLEPHAGAAGSAMAAAGSGGRVASASRQVDCECKLTDQLTFAAMQHAAWWQYVRSKV